MDQLLGFLQRFGIGRLAAIVGVAAGVAAALFALVFNAGSEPKALLYSNLDLKEASSITQALDQSGIKYEAKGDGSTIMVPRDKVASTRLMLSGKGLPTSGSVGYEIFDNASALGQTDFVQNLNRQRALEGELARTIRSLDGVTFARVQLVLPKHQLFEEEAGEPSASVVIGVAGRQPATDQVRALQNLVAGAVPNLKPERVTIVDQNSKLLGGGEGASAADALADDQRTATEEKIKKRIRELVEGVVGPGKARVQVTADLDLNQVTTQEEKFDPDGQVVRSTQTTEESSKQNQADGNGQATATANVPGTPGANPGSTTSGSSSGQNQETTNYEISKTTKTTVEQPGTVKKLSIAVAVDGVTAPGVKGKPGAYTPRTAQEMERIDQLVKSAVGFDASRGDNVSVINVQFQHDDAAAGAGGAVSANKLTDFDKNDLMRAGELVIGAAVALAIIFFVARPLLSATGGGGAPMGGRLAFAGAGTGHVPVSQISVDPNTGEALALPPPSDIDQRIDIAKIEGQVRASSVKSVADFVDKHPEESVSILRNWLHDA
ncbi:flagellar basal-body MS-ring/collar protein FliF [Phenylobacterium montanum]|uniref:Flagellar M-ring protein n=1 Tax=Phenylobacterium montanum TaxID=2823693 RepID=A0A975G3K4_9CAUL|nr:flagellar basal-body MS-ring/collar protein FliF [Caulobacter sp. S6]QUD90036.1 flagellar M-ring protein FliF [Caulobacter sp. S6]